MTRLDRLVVVRGSREKRGAHFKVDGGQASGGDHDGLVAAVADGCRDLVVILFVRIASVRSVFLCPDPLCPESH